MTIEFIKAGLQTSLQDIGRLGYRRYGISQAGAIDPISMQMANWLVGKPKHSVCLEIYLIGPIIKFSSDMAIGIAGAEFEVFHNDIPIDTHKTIKVKSGEVLKFGKLISGARAYLSFSRPFAEDATVQKVLGSYSTDITSKLGNNQGVAINDGKCLKFVGPERSLAIKRIPATLQIKYSSNPIVRVNVGNEFSLLSKASQSSIFENKYSINPNSNRMGIRLSGQALKIKANREMVSSPIVIGTVQLPKNGQPIIILNEGQTVGGYPRIAQVISADLPLLGQLKPNSKVSFYPITVQKGLNIMMHKQALINFPVA